jgi:sugar O-acyltransferase (sialic acid O-acetyltransferase NeuD family)
MKKLVILGAGGHAKVVIESAQAMGNFDSIVALDDRYPALNAVLDIPVVGPFQHYAEVCTPDAFAFVAIGDNVRRAQWLTILASQNIALATIIHPQSWISPSARLGAGVFVAPLAAISSMSQVGLGSIINTSAVVGHDCVVETCAHIAPHATIVGGAHVGHLAWVGMGANVLGGVTIGHQAIIGAGSVVREAVLAKQTVVGVPARLIKAH